LVEAPGEITRAREQNQLLSDILDNVEAINPMLRTIIREQGGWNLNLLEERIRELIGEPSQQGELF
jgi:hypothetical protein